MSNLVLLDRGKCDAEIVAVYGEVQGHRVLQHVHDIIGSQGRFEDDTCEFDYKLRDAFYKNLTSILTSDENVMYIMRWLGKKHRDVEGIIIQAVFASYWDSLSKKHKQ